MICGFYLEKPSRNASISQVFRWTIQLLSSIHRLYLAKGAMATTAIEGNTLSEEEVRKRVDGQLELPLSKEYLGHEIDNIVEACNAIGRGLLEGEFGNSSVSTVEKLNKFVLKNLPLPDHVVPGKVRTELTVGVDRYRGAPAEDCHHLLDQLCRWLNDERDRAPKRSGIVFGLLRAIVGHIYLAWIHPFGDGNGRTARLMEFMILLDAGVPFPAGHLLSNHYNQTRQRYYQELDRASKSGGDLVPFITYAVQGFVDGLKEQLDLIRSAQWDVAWRDFVHQRFATGLPRMSSAVRARRRELVLQLSAEQEPVPISKLRLLSARLAELYAKKTAKTISRDVNALEEMSLVDQTPEGVSARTETILAFLPLRKD